MSAVVPGQPLAPRRTTLRDARRAYAACYAEHSRRVMACEKCDATARWGGVLNRSSRWLGVGLAIGSARLHLPRKARF